MSERRFVDIVMPERFILEYRSDDGSWTDWGLYFADSFMRLPDGSYTTDHSNGSPVHLRCVRQRELEIEVIVGTSERDTYRLVPFPSERYFE